MGKTFDTLATRESNGLALAALQLSGLSAGLRGTKSACRNTLQSTSKKNSVVRTNGMDRRTHDARHFDVANADVLKAYDVVRGKRTEGLI